MRRIEQKGLTFYRSELLFDAGANNFFLTRKGGVSSGPYAELNMSFRVGDDAAAVLKNYRKVKEAAGLKSLATVHQVHDARILDLDHDPVDEKRLRGLEFDGMVTTREKVGIGVLVADCFPLVLMEAKRKIIAIAHCGRKGIVGGIIENALKAMVEKQGELKNIIAALGPGVCAKCYAVGDEIISEFKDRFPQGAGAIWRRESAAYHLDLKSAIFSVLKESGLGSEQIDDLGLCTCCSEEFFSHRRSKGKTGRQLAAAVIE
jgi:YfiH family protein